MNPDWKAIAKEVEAAFADGSVLLKDRQTLERWMVALCVGSHESMLDQEPMLRRLDSIKHLVAVRLAEEADRRRDEAQSRSSAAMQRHNFFTRWIAVAGIVITAIIALANYLKPSTTEQTQPQHLQGAVTNSVPNKL